MQTKRLRRSRDTVRALLLNAARKLFSERGYSGTVTREIAARANVSEVLLFRHFKSKALLFEEAIFDPMDSYIRDFQRAHLSSGKADPGGLPETRDFMAGLLSWLSSNRHLLMALVAAEAYESDVQSSLKESPALKDYFKAAERYMKQNQPLYRVELPLGVRLSFATAVAAVLFQDWLFADLPRRLRSDEFLHQITLYMLGGLEGSHSIKRASGARKARVVVKPSSRKRVGAKKE